jgi:inositol 1,4,5-triphosphate receptor type 1
VPEVFSVAALRLFYDVSFFIIVTTIGLNIVFGIIVDTFSELRDERVSASIAMPLSMGGDYY